ncbi:MAG: glyoxalase superfamily protein [Planctomycetota bacterium]
MSNESASPSSLPERPSIEFLRKLAKERLVELRVDQPSAKLADAQRAVAREHGLPSWRALKEEVEKRHVDRYAPFVAMIQRNDVGAIAAAIDADPSLVRVGLEGHRRTALHLSAWQNKPELVRLLLDRGADPNARDRGDHAYPMHFAAELGYLPIVEMLADAGGDVRGGGDTHGLGVLGWATCMALTRHDVAAYLLDRGATHHVFSAVALGDGDALRRIVDADPTALTRTMSRWEMHRTPLHLAVTKQQYAMIDLLLDLGADPYLTDKNQQTPLHLALVKDDAESISRFEQRGVVLDEYTETNTPLTGVTPILNVKNVPASIDYYVDKLGFHEDWAWGDPVGFASVSRGEVTLFLCQDGQGQPGTWMSVWTEDVDALHAEYVKRGAIIKQPPTNFPWGVREMNVADPDGHRLRFGSNITGEPDGVPLKED